MRDFYFMYVLVVRQNSFTILILLSNYTFTLYMYNVFFKIRFQNQTPFGAIVLLVIRASQLLTECPGLSVLKHRLFVSIDRHVCIHVHVHVESF